MRRRRRTFTWMQSYCRFATNHHWVENIFHSIDFCCTRRFQPIKDFISHSRWRQILDQCWLWRFDFVLIFVNLYLIFCNSPLSHNHTVIKIWIKWCVFWNSNHVNFIYLIPDFHRIVLNIQQINSPTPYVPVWLYAIYICWCCWLTSLLMFHA